MSRHKERKERNCLNCNTEVQGRYCHVCGQENIEPVETAWEIVTHFFKDITHFDGKFFSTLKYLIARPGFISREYMAGKRASYLNPVRMYVFTSALFFLIFFSLAHFDESNIKTDINGRGLDEIARMDSTAFNTFTKSVNNGIPMTREQFAHYADTVKKKGTFRMAPNKYRDKAQYDSLLKAGVENDGWIKRAFVYKQIELDEKYHRDGNKVIASFINALLHSFPQMLFISLPLFALFLKLLYFRKKGHYYAGHLIFSIHIYVFDFIIMLILIGIKQLQNVLDWDIFDWIFGIGILYILFYHYKAMRKFYGQKRGITILKFILLNILMLTLIILLFVAFSIFSIFKI